MNLHKITLCLLLILYMSLLGCNYSNPQEDRGVDTEVDRGSEAAEVEQSDDISIGKENLLNTIENYEMLTRLYQAVKVSGLLEELAQEGPYTLLAPANIAFDKATGDETGNVSGQWDKEKTKDILSSHIIKGKYQSANLLDADDLVAINGKKIQVIGKDNLLQIDIEASNGIIQIIDTLLVSAN